MSSIKFIIVPIMLLVLIAAVQAHKRFHGGQGPIQPACKCDCYEPGYQGSGGYAPSNGPPIPTGGHYGNAGYHQPRPIQSGYGNAGAHAVAGSYGSGGGQVNGGY